LKGKGSLREIINFSARERTEKKYLKETVGAFKKANSFFKLLKNLWWWTAASGRGFLKGIVSQKKRASRRSPKGTIAE